VTVWPETSQSPASILQAFENLFRKPDGGSVLFLKIPYLWSFMLKNATCFALCLMG
jgi:hypothetical protein